MSWRPGRTVQVARQIAGALRPLTGDPGSGAASAAATGDDVCIPKSTFAIPVPLTDTGLSMLDEQRLVRTTETVIATSAGVTEIPVETLLGGERHNVLDAGSALLWDPPIYGLEKRGTLTTGITGATNPPELHGFVKSISFFENITPGTIAQDLFMARLHGAIPAIVISWQSSQEGTLKGRHMKHRPDIWTIFVAVDNPQSEPQRRTQGTIILDAIEALLTDRGSALGSAFSSPPARVMGRARVAVTESSLVYSLTLATWNTVCTLDLRDIQADGMTAEDFGAIWTQTGISAHNHDTEDPPIYRIEDARFPMASRGFGPGWGRGYG